uniref:Titin n=1 Tax=Ascaris suum TaxID=6253 RepID=F1KYB5_ASCSU
MLVLLQFPNAPAVFGNSCGFSYHNGTSLAAAHRFRPVFDFGYVALDILYAYPEDSGTYTLVARNELGEVQSNLELVVNSKKTPYLRSHYPRRLERIRELEQNKTKPCRILT